MLEDVPVQLLTASSCYALPKLLQDIDMLELTGSTVHASAALSISQPSVSRRYRTLAEEFGLERQRRLRTPCRFGSSPTLRLLRLGCRLLPIGRASYRFVFDNRIWIGPRGPETWEVLLPSPEEDPALHQALERRRLPLRTVGTGCVTRGPGVGSSLPSGHPILGGGFCFRCRA